MPHILLGALITLLLAAPATAGPCLNKFLNRSEGPRQIVTLLTGKLTFQEAQELSAAIATRKAPPLEWVDASGKTIATQFGELKVVRPMPVGCDDKPSGVVMIATFATVQTPASTMHVRLEPKTTVEFSEQ
ncbi:MAG TPA: hypothetical protein VFT12_04235 [Thermoanaerobaculia bacterium]|nr:hypothetical protein [Thermoanaerobaculia bacterium]